MEKSSPQTETFGVYIIEFRGRGRAALTLRRKGGWEARVIAFDGILRD